MFFLKAKSAANSHMRVIVQLILVACLWSTGGVLIKLVDWNRWQFVFVRGLVTLLILLVMNKKKKLRLTKTALPVLFLMRELPSPL